MNADVDYIISAVQLLKALDAPSRTDHMTTHPVIATIDELQQTVAYSMATCSGIERHFSNSKLFDEIVETASKLKHEVCFVAATALLIPTVNDPILDSQSA